MYVKARCKINLTLNVLDKREDGYHNINSVFQPITLYDEMYINENHNGKFNFDCNVKELNNENNIIYKAYELMKHQFKQIGGIDVKLIKHIPTEAGLGGGSADCATFLKAMNNLFNLSLVNEELIKIGSKLGADVPACMYNFAVLGQGIGEKITKIKTNMKYYILIVKPNLSCNTKQMYNKLDNMKITENKKSTSNVIKSLEENDIELLSKNLYNSFENVLDKDSIIFEIKEEFKKNNACATLMSGSGSCVYGIYYDKQEMKSAYRNIKDKYTTYFCLSYNKGGKHL